MKRFVRSVFSAFAIAFVPVLFFVRYMETMNRFDSLGWWYSVYVTAGFVVPFALVAGAIWLFALRFRSRGS